MVLHRLKWLAGRSISRIGKKLTGAGAFGGASSKELALLVKKIAETGEGSEDCLKQSCLPLPVHYYSPVPDIGDLQKRGVFARRSPLLGVDMRIEAQLALLEEIGRAYGAECRWPHESPRGQDVFYTDNSGFSYGCAAALHSMIRKSRPHHVVEIGSGSSSRIISAALALNAGATSQKPRYTIVDPYPTEQTQELPGITQVMAQRIELLEPTWFEQLEANDILFVDSGHTVRAGGDVNFLILDVLPRLAPGVIVHFHDIPLPYEYAEVYFTNPRFRMFWTEAYLLQAFLMFNHSFEVVLAMNFLMQDHADAFRKTWPHYDPRIHRYPSHSFWIRRTR